MSSVAGLQRIAPVPTSSDFIDLVLNTTMRKTPTVIHKNVSEILYIQNSIIDEMYVSSRYLESEIVRYQSYQSTSLMPLDPVYMRKVKFTQDTFDEKLGRIISEFPILDVSARHERITKSNADREEPSPLPVVSVERIVRQEPLQTRFGAA